MVKEIDPANYVWVITDYSGPEETFLGLTHPDGQPFIPVTATREEAEALLEKLPPGEGKREVEAIHKGGLIQEAARQGFAVYLVDGQGALQGPLRWPEE